MKKIIFIALAMCLPFLVTAQTVSPDYQNTFESNSLAPEVYPSNDSGNNPYYDYTANGGTIECVANPLQSGVNTSNYCMETYTPFDERARAEHNIFSCCRFETADHVHGYKWKMLIPTDMWTDKVWDAQKWAYLMQFKTDPCERYGENREEYDYTIFKDGRIEGAGGIFNDLKWEVDDSLRFRFRAKPNFNTFNYDANNIMGEWAQFALIIYWTEDSDGWYKLYVNDSLVYEQSNVQTLMDGFLEGTCDIYWALGLYTQNYSDGNGTTDGNYVYYDDAEFYQDATMETFVTWSDTTGTNTTDTTTVTPVTPSDTTTTITDTNPQGYALDDDGYYIVDSSDGDIDYVFSVSDYVICEGDSVTMKIESDAGLTYYFFYASGDGFALSTDTDDNTYTVVPADGDELYIKVSDGGEHTTAVSEEVDIIANDCIAVAPTITGAYVYNSDPDMLYVTFDVSVSVSSITGISLSGDQAISSINDGSGTTVSFNLDSNFSYGDESTITFTSSNTVTNASDGTALAATSYEISNNVVPTLSLSDTEVDAGNTVTLTATGGDSYTFYVNSESVETNTTGTYTYTPYYNDTVYASIDGTSTDEYVIEVNNTLTYVTDNIAILEVLSPDADGAAHGRYYSGLDYSELNVLSAHIINQYDSRFYVNECMYSQYKYGLYTNESSINVRIPTSSPLLAHKLMKIVLLIP